jgi:hypothetical protein
VVIDEPRTNVVQHFTPHNSWGFEGNKGLPKRPDGLRVTYYDEDQDYQEAEIIVYDTGKGSNNATLFESITLPGVTKKSLVIDHARWHMAQMKLRPEVYVLNTDLEYLVCNRGDRVKVVHDVPMWGLGSGRVKNRVSTTQLELDETMPMTAGTVYTVRFRSKTGSSIVRNVVPKPQDGYYNIIELNAAVTVSEADAGDLFLFGEISQESQDLLVLSIEPSTNNTARITLVDYGVTPTYNIFTDYLNLTESVVFESQLSLPQQLQINSLGLKVPTITSLISDGSAMEEIAFGVYQYSIKVAFINSVDLPTTATTVQGEIILKDAQDNTNARSVFVPLETGNLIFNNVDVEKIYKIRLRYVGRDGRTGQWTEYQEHTVVGRVQNFQLVDQLTVIRSKRNLVITPYIEIVPNDFKFFEFRVWKDLGTGDFWDNADPESGIRSYASVSAVTVDLRDFQSPRLSKAGTKYRVACRVLDNAGNYSNTSTLGSITIKTISP